jgi:TonB family protein
MAHQPIPFPSPREEKEPVTGSHSLARSFQLVEPARVGLSPEDMAVLREQMGTDGLDLNAFLDKIVKHAQALTGSSGAAVALRHGTVILCRARCGETSPSLGAQLDADFGISGECLRTGKALRCEDSEEDLRLDPEVCRQLGLRSIAVVPIFESTTVAGILEVFAGQPHAFDDRHLEILQQLAELVTTVGGRVTQENQDTISEGMSGPRSEARQEIPEAEVKTYASPSRRERLRKWTAPIALRRYYAAAIAIFAPAGLLAKRLRKWTAPITSRQYHAAAVAIFAPAGLLAKRLRRWTAPVASRQYYAAAAIAIFMLAGLLTILVWKPWHRTERTVVPSTKTVPRAETVPASAATMETRRRLNIPEPRAVGRNVTSAYPTPSDRSYKVEAQKAARVQPLSGEDVIVVPSRSSQTRDRAGPANAAEPLAPIPLIGTTGGFGKDANVADSALFGQANLPLMVSQGVSGGSLERKVQPIYPPDARSARLQGPVVLEAVIDEAGEVRNLRTVSGDAVLAQAAIDAVRQWHYQPYKLNGQPVKMPIQITVNFTLP